ncbi:MAG: pantothenate kinase [Halioglobus sp.]
MASTSLQIDIGNSSAKWRLVQGEHVIARGRYRPDDEDSRRALLAVQPAPVEILVASVATEAQESALAQMLRTQWQVDSWFARTPQRSGRLVNSYADASRMGVDRWLAMLGALQKVEDQGTETRLAVVDAGSALTIDLVAASGQHEGGFIIPGAQLMERALLLDTDRVRFAEDIGYDLLPGTSTAEAVRHGIALAQVGAVSLALARAGAPQPRVFFCGGGAEPLLQLLELDAELVPDLVFEGLQVMHARG